LENITRKGFFSVQTLSSGLNKTLLRAPSWPAERPLGRFQLIHLSLSLLFKKKSKKKERRKLHIHCFVDIKFKWGRKGSSRVKYGRVELMNPPLLHENKNTGEYFSFSFLFKQFFLLLL